MINYHTSLVAALQTILPTHYEMVLHSGLKVPCISYMEITNVDDITGNTIGYSRITYQVKVWGNNIEEIQHYALLVDKELRKLGLKRIGCNELYDPNSTMIQKIMSYEALALENY
jgi:predicted transcriptional regulator YheO